MITGRRLDVILAGHAGDADTARAALDDPDPTVRTAALGALARAGALTAHHVAAALDDPEGPVRRRAAEEAGRLGDPSAVAALLAHVDDADDAVVEAAAHALGELDAGAHAQAVVEALAGIATAHPEVVLRETAVAALGSLAGAPAELAEAPLAAAVEAVLAASHDVATVRRRAVLALAAFDGPEVEAALERLTLDRDRQVRQAAEDLRHGWGADG